MSARHALKSRKKMIVFIFNIEIEYEGIIPKIKILLYVYFQILIGARIICKYSSEVANQWHVSRYNFYFKFVCFKHICFSDCKLTVTIVVSI